MTDWVEPARGGFAGGRRGAPDPSGDLWTRRRQCWMECKPREARRRRWKRLILFFGVLAASVLGLAPAALAAESTGGEASLVLPDLGDGQLPRHLGQPPPRAMGSSSAPWVWSSASSSSIRLRKLPAHRSMREISELIWQTCKTYLLKQGQFLILLWVFIAIVIGVYFGALEPLHGRQGDRHPALQHPRDPGQLRRGLVRHPGQHLRQLAHGFRQPAGASRTTSTPSRCARA